MGNWLEIGRNGNRARRRVVGRAAGFSLVEVMVAVVILTIGIAGISSSMLSAITLNRVNRETALAHQAARRAIEEITGVPFEEVWEVYNSNPGEPVGALVERGPDFAVDELDPQAADPDGMCGRIQFPTMLVGGLEELREDVVDPGLGMPRDLDGDGVWPEAVSIGLDYSVLPVRVLIEWRGVSGNRAVELETMLCNR